LITRCCFTSENILFGVFPGEDFKVKWKNLRNTYRRHKRENVKKSGAGAQPRKQWKWAKLLRFIDDITEYTS
jgi:hypothetical protein